MKNIFNSIAVSLLLALAVLVAVPASGQTYVSFTTLSSAVTSTSSQSNTFKLASTSGITAGNTMLYIEGEADFVDAVTTTPATVTVVRGAGPSSRVSTHPSGAVVWYGPPSYFQSATPVGYPFGSCSRTSGLVVPYIDITNNVYSDCYGGKWVRGLDGQSPAILFSPSPGGAVLTGVGTSTATTDTSMYCSQIYLPQNKLLTGLWILNGTATTNGHRNVILYDAAGNLLANSGSTTTTGTASQYQQFAFTSQYFAVGPAWFWGCSQSQSSSDTLNLIATADGNAGTLTQIYTGQTYGTVPTTITPSTTYTTLQGPYFAFY
jgi:hypothetical protein